MTPKERAADRRLKREYNITLDQYNKVLAWQGNKCAICRTPQRSRRLAVDHHHTTGQVRGLLCWECNKALAVLRDCYESFVNAARYLANPPVSASLGVDIFTAPGRVGTKKRARLLRKMELNSTQEKNVTRKK